MRQSRTRASPSCQSPRLGTQYVPFDASRLTSDGDLAWIAQVDAALRLCAARSSTCWRRWCANASYKKGVEIGLTSAIRVQSFGPSRGARRGENFPFIGPVNVQKRGKTIRLWSGFLRQPMHDSQHSP